MIAAIADIIVITILYFKKESGRKNLTGDCISIVKIISKVISFQTSVFLNGIDSIDWFENVLGTLIMFPKAGTFVKEGMGETCFRSEICCFSRKVEIDSYWIYWIGLDFSCLLFVFNCHVVHLSALNFLPSFSVTLKLLASNDYNCRQYHIHFYSLTISFQE